MSQLSHKTYENFIKTTAVVVLIATNKVEYTYRFTVTTAVQVKQSVRCVCVCVRTQAFEQNDL